MDELLICNDIEYLPIWNLNKIQTTGDLRYLYVLKNYYTLPEINRKSAIELEKAYNQIISQFSNLDLRIQYLFTVALWTYLEYKSERQSQQKVNNTFFKYLNYLNTIYKDYEYNEIKFENSISLYNFIKTNYTDYEELILNRLEIFDYRFIKAKAKHKYDLYEDVIQLREILNQHIDIKTTTVKEYNALKQYAIKKVETTNRKNNGR